ncbi:hypothetical protein [Ureibacillus manganicus]|uniref:Transcription initiation factor TFIIIB n=1 Tax=Ureibacillus manganicus DSM 26584 TaxID=1384049 RepID=A0A0A3I5Q2_9BACL|nr:hypothetical protein [Ureibacillus manganicus]KGR78023.1 hypothetical protein CD29_12770 [Ureibacillus manganicus DSM 26584]
MSNDKKCPNCNGSEFKEATDFIPIRLKKSSFTGSNKIYTFCLNCGEVVSIRIENPEKFR